MSTLIFRLNNVEADEAEEVRLAGGGGHSAVDDEGGAGHVGGVVGGEEGDHRRDLLRLAHAAHGDELRVLLVRAG